LADRDFKKKKCETAVPAEEKLPRVFDEQLRDYYAHHQSRVLT
jgi:hypothetical protein